MKLFEIFDKPIGAVSKKNTDDHMTQEITLRDGTILELSFSRGHEFTSDNCWYFSFTRRAAGAHSWTSTMAKTGEGNEVEVFSSVVAAVTKFFNEYDPDVFLFSAEKVFDDPRTRSRANLYQRMAKRLAGASYELETDNDYDIIHFMLKKKGSDVRTKDQLSDYA